MVIAVEYELYQQRPRVIVFSIAERRAQSLTICNRFARRHAQFKIQCTSSKKFRVRPAFADLPPSALVRVNIQLSPQEREPCECKFLVVVREVDDPAASSNAHGSDSEHEMKMRWKRAERRDHESLLFSETVDVHVIETQPSNQTRSVVAADHKEEARVPALASSLEYSPQLPVNSLSEELTNCIQRTAAGPCTSQQGEIVVLMMKNQSAQPENKLTEQEAEKLKRLRASCTPEQWQIWEVYAYRMRVLLREQSRRSSK